MRAEVKKRKRAAPPRPPKAGVKEETRALMPRKESSVFFIEMRGVLD